MSFCHFVRYRSIGWRDAHKASAPLRPFLRFSHAGVPGQSLAIADNSHQERSLVLPFDYGDFLSRQAVQVIHQPVNLRVRRVNLALDGRPFMQRGRHERP
jgi:hypothetical protein